MDITELFGPNRTGINQTHDFFFDLPNPRKMTLYNLQLNFILFLFCP